MITRIIAHRATLTLAALALGACTNAAADAADAADAGDVPNRAPAATAAAAPAPANTPDGAAPRAGRWAGVAANGFKGDSILFTVARDGRTVTDVEFRGHWRCGATPSSRTIKTMDVGHVPGTFGIAAAGTFGEEKREPYLLWTVAGTFTGARAASGTIRIEYDTECDTFKLNWTAAPV